MDKKNEDPFGMATMLNTWMKSMGELWGNTAGQWGASPPGHQPAGAKAGRGASPKTHAAMAAAFKNWRRNP